MNNINLKNISEQLIDTFFEAGKIAREISDRGVKITIKEDKSPVTDGDLEVDLILRNKIKKLTPDIPIVSEETVNLKEKNTAKTFWLIDPIDGTKDYIKKKDEYTLNAALIIDLKPSMGMVYAPAKDRLFYSYAANNAFEISNGKNSILNGKKINTNENIGLINSDKTQEEILKVYKENKVSKFIKMSSSLKFCTLAAGEADIYVAKARAYEWDIAAGHAILEHAGGSVRTLDGNNFLYGKIGYKNLPLIAKRSKKIF